MDQTVVYTCPTCNDVFTYEMFSRKRCLVLHHPGQCCHYGETRLSKGRA